MRTGPEAFTANYAEGIRKVLKENFAFLLTKDLAKKFANMYPEDFILIDTNMMQVSSGVTGQT